MKKDIILSGEKVNLKILTKENRSENYLGWLSDKEINQYLEIRHSFPTTIEEADAFTESMFKSETNYFFGIFAQEKHIGNIKLGNIDTLYSRADIGLVLGDKEFWGQGIASEAIKLITHFGFDQLKLNKITAGAYGSNIGSIKAFLKNGFTEEARLKKHYKLDNGSWEDGVLLAKFNENNNV